MNDNLLEKLQVSKDTIRRFDHTCTDPTDLFDVKECIGKGNFGDVYKAIEKSTNEVYAVKVVNLEETDDDINVLVQEIAFLAQLRSDHITNYYQTLVTDVYMWIVMEYCGGGSCADLLKCHKQLNEDIVCFIIRETLKGLDYLHGQKKVHRDIKAANILLTTNGMVKLADFGVSGQITQTHARRDTFVGTPFWMAPEVISRRSGYNEKVDIWSLGITTIELITGSPPHSDREPMKVLFEIPKNPSPLLTGDKHSDPIKDFVRSCLSKSPKYRPSADELLKSKFIKSCKRGISLVPLIQAKDEWMAAHRPHKRPRYNLADKLYQKSEASLRWNFTRRPKSVLAEIYEGLNPLVAHLDPYSFDGDGLYQLGSAMNNTSISDYVIFNNNSPQSDQISPINENYQVSGETCLTSPESQPRAPNSYTKQSSQQPPKNTKASNDHKQQHETELESPTAIIHTEEKITQSINYLEDVLMLCLKRVHHRARSVETKAVVAELARGIKNSESQQPGLAEALSEEIWLRMVDLRGQRYAKSS